MNNTEAKAVKRKLIYSFIGGVGFAILTLMVLGETGGNYHRSVIRKWEQDYADYSRRCEASLNRSYGALTMAEGMHADLANQRDKALANGR